MPYGIIGGGDYGQKYGGGNVDTQTDLTQSYRGAESHDEAMANIQAEAMRKSLALQEAQQQFRQNMATQQINQARKSTQQARRVAAQQLSGLTSALPQGMAGWESNFIAQLTPTGIGQGAAAQAAEHLGAIKEAVGFGIVKDLSKLLRR